MGDYYIKAILLDGCRYSIAANKLLTIHNIQADIVNVNDLNKNKYKTTQINTFPQIYLCKSNNNGTLLLGGYDNLSEFISEFKGKKFNEHTIEKFMDKYSWSKKATLRLIQLIN